MRCILLKEILHPLPMFLLDIVFIWLWFVPSCRIVLNCGVLALLRIQLLLRLYSAELLSIFYPPLQYRTGIALSSCGYFLCFTGLTFRTCSFWSNVFCFHQITLIFFLMCHFASQVLARVPQGNCFVPLIGCHHLATFISRGWFGCGISCHL